MLIPPLVTTPMRLALVGGFALRSYASVEIIFSGKPNLKLRHSDIIKLQGDTSFHSILACYVDNLV